MNSIREFWREENIVAAMNCNATECDTDE